jgi:rRNA maturation endonuclease Nob1
LVNISTSKKFYFKFHFETVVDYAKKSGDFAALSITDLKLIALTLMLDCETSGKGLNEKVIFIY